MRCFKLFFKHTWQPQQLSSISLSTMDNNSNCCNIPKKHEVNIMNNTTRFEVTKSEIIEQNATELGEVKITTTTTASTSGKTGSISCRNGACKASVTRQSGSESPWHILKTIFLVSFIVALILWIIVFSLLSQYGLL